MSVTSIRRVSFYSSWLGGISSSPEHRIVHLDNVNDCFLRRDSACPGAVSVDARLVAVFLAAVRQPVVPQLDLGCMGLTAAWALDLAPALIERRSRELRE